MEHRGSDARRWPWLSLSVGQPATDLRGTVEKEGDSQTDVVQAQSQGPYETSGIPSPPGAGAGATRPGPRPPCHPVSSRSDLPEPLSSDQRATPSSRHCFTSY